MTEKVKRHSASKRASTCCQGGYARRNGNANLGVYMRGEDLVRKGPLLKFLMVKKGGFEGEAKKQK